MAPTHSMSVPRPAIPTPIRFRPMSKSAGLATIVLCAKEEGWKLSIDSFASETQLWALDEGVAYVNDIQGFADTSIYPYLAAATAKLIVMHAVQGAGKAQKIDTDPATIMGRIADFSTCASRRFTRAGISRDRLILDPGMGLFVGTRPGEVSLTCWCAGCRS